MSHQERQTMNIGGRLVAMDRPQVMGILNCTPDSFFAGSRKQTEKELAERANQIVEEGGTIIDIGAYSTRPGAMKVSEEEEMRRLRNALTVVKREQPEAVLSIDTFRPDVARMCVEEFGAAIINDVSEGGLAFSADEADRLTADSQTATPEIFEMVARLRVPYILMSVRPTMEAMLTGFAREVEQLRQLGVSDVILDPGFGFGKTLEQNYLLMNNLEKLQVMENPVLVGVSRKRMIWQLLDSSTDEALNGTTVLNTLALAKGASILRVHDVREAVEAVKMVEKMRNAAN